MEYVNLLFSKNRIKMYTDLSCLGFVVDVAVEVAAAAEVVVVEVVGLKMLPFHDLAFPTKIDLSNISLR